MNSGTLITKNRIVRVRGWSEKAVAQLLGKCDKRMENPYFKSPTLMQMYEVERILAAEKTPDFAAFKEAKRQCGIASSKSQIHGGQVAPSVLPRTFDEQAFAKAIEQQTSQGLPVSQPAPDNKYDFTQED